jgi:radical SAM superfamily enzyme YgiQ (UPF0313 family)
LDYLKSTIETRKLATVRTLDLALCKKSEFKTRLLLALSEQPVDVVGFSFRNLTDQLYQGNTYTASLSDLLQFTKDYIQQTHANTKMVVGGAACSLLPESLKEMLPCDHIVEGEGEEAFTSILSHLSDGHKLPKILRVPVSFKDFSYRRGSWGYIDEYQQLGAMGNLQTKRGCSRRCIYCSYPVIEGKLFRMRDPDVVAKEMKQLERLGFDQVYIVDATFNNPLLHSKWVLEAFLRHKTTAKWTGFFNPSIDQELIDLVKATHMALPLKFTIESGSDKMLQSLQKGFDTEYIAKACQLCHRNSIPFSFTIIFGSPGENDDTVRET